MDINNPIVTPNARGVGGRCLLNGVEVPFVSFDVESNSFKSASTFNLTLATSALPAAMGLLSYWSTQTTIKVELSVKLTTASGTDEKKLIVGNIDSWEFNPAHFEITASGRDFTGLLIDAKSAGESFKNYTSSQIASLLAQRHGLTPIVTATRGRFGEFYQIDSAHLTGEQTEWDLLNQLAAIEGYTTYVDGNSLYFQPIPDPAKAKNYVIRWQPPGSLAYPQCNVSDDLHFTRALTISKGIKVEVKSWNSKRKNRQFVATYPKTTATSTSAQPQLYSIVRNGLSPETADALAMSIYKSISQHEMKFTASTAGDNLLTPQTLIRIEGTQSPFDQTYYCDSVHRSLSWDAGYTMSISGKNHSPALETSS
ncbi:phage late control D family protein [Rouxiella sp. WC2420]|uniref:Phage late control D family protein n=1 Tax=Rouxiella sp. WC2420 TaxID=3234145 RepID=A0AB39VK54_9GAMM